MAEKTEGEWAKVPVEAIEDRRLTATEFRVLVTLMSFVRKSPTVWPSRKSISERCGVDPSHISRATAALVRYGWLEKTGTGGRSSSSRYTVKQPPITCADSARVNDAETCADSARVNDAETCADSARVNDKTCADSARGPCADSARGKEKNNESYIDATTNVAAPDHDPEQIAPDPVRFDGVRWRVDEAVFDSWITAYARGRTNQDTEDWIEAELVKASLWLQANPRKHKKNYLRFLTGWLTRAADGVRSHGQYKPRPYH